MNFRTRLKCGVATLAVAATLQTGTALAQSTGTQVQELVITGFRETVSPTGLIKAEQVPKQRSTVTDEYLGTQNAGQSIADSLNLLPGVNFTNSDAYGSSGGNIRLRGFDGNRVGLLLDGMPLNDSGNYAVFTNQMLDPEIIGQTTVNQGTTDVDSPSPSAAGGIINVQTRKPRDELNILAVGTLGSENYKRFFGSFDTGFNGLGMGAFGTWSKQRYEKFKGPGSLNKTQYNFRIFQKLEGDDFISVAGHYNRNRNAFYRNLSKAQIAFYGEDYDNLRTCTRTTPGAGAQNDGASPAGTGGGAFLSANDNPANPASCTNFFGLRINPSNTGNIRAQSRFTFWNWLTLTFDPSFQYVLANGGGTNAISETDGRLRGSALAVGVNLNGDADTADTIRLYNPNTTNTRRYGFTTSLIADLDEHSRVRLAYTLDYAQHRQTGDFGILDAFGNPQHVYGGKDGQGIKVVSADGVSLRGRDRYSNAILNQVAAEYRGEWGEFTLNLGVRAPYFFRRLHQFCYSQNLTNGTVRCTTEPVATVLPSGMVELATTGGTDYIRPFRLNKSYDDVLPSAGASYRIHEDHLVYASYGTNFSAPRTDNLYSPFVDAACIAPCAIQLPGVQPETSQVFDLGWRYQGTTLLTSLDVWSAKFKNRVVTSFDQVLGISIDRNVGNVDQWGVDAEAGWEVMPDLVLYASASYNQSELKNNIPTGIGTFLATAGKTLVETPDWTFSTRAEYDIGGFGFGAQVKYVGDRYSTDLNDDVAPSYVKVDANISYDLSELGASEGSFARLNVVNLFDEDYLGSISSTNTAAGNPTFSIGAPRTIQFSVGMDF